MLLGRLADPLQENKVERVVRAGLSQLALAVLLGLEQVELRADAVQDGLVPGCLLCLRPLAQRFQLVRVLLVPDEGIDLV